MSKKVEIYNAYFGDCIVLKDEDDDSNLLVDFGVHYISKVAKKYGSRECLLEEIENGIIKSYSNKNISLLITHFHEDHISGLIHMYKNKKCKNFFRNIYIANIWNNPFIVASNLLEEMLLENELKKCDLPRTTASLFDLLDFFSDNVQGIKLLKRGDLFENDKYITLWPEIDNKENYISEIIQSLELPEEFGGNLLTLANSACTFMENILSDNRNYYVNATQEMRSFYNMLFLTFIEHAVNDGQNMQKEKLD